MWIKPLFLLASLGLLPACATVSAPDLIPVRDGVAERSALIGEFSLDLDRRQSEQRTRELLAKPLTPVTVQELTLLNNPSLHAALAALGVAEADRVQAGLVSNPVFAVGALTPEGGGSWQLDFGLSQSLIDLMTRSLRQSLARSHYRQVQLEVTQALAAALLDTELHFYEAVAANHRAAMLRSLAEAATIRGDLANRFYSAGNITELRLLLERTQAAEWRLRADRARGEAEVAAYALATRLGLTDITALQLPQQLAQLPREQFQVEALAQRALLQRLDLSLLRHAGGVRESELALADRAGGWETLEIGAKAEREFDGQRNYGPELAFSLPIFHQGQAATAAARARLSQSRYRLQALEIQVRNEVAQALTTLQTYRRQAEQMRALVIPQRERLTQLTLKEYNFMLSDAFAALEAKHDEYQAYLAYIDVLAEFWQARAALNRAVGGGLRVASSDPAPLPQPQSQPGAIHKGHGAGAHEGHEVPAQEETGSGPSGSSGSPDGASPSNPSHHNH